VSWALLPKRSTIWQIYGKDLGAGLASLIYILTPEAIVIGGSASAEFSSCGSGD